MSELDDSDGPEGAGEGLLAAEFALGVLSGPEHESARRRLAADPAFAAEVGLWQRRLAALLEEVAPATPPREVWGRIALAVDPPRSAAAEPARTSLWRSLPFWRGLAFGSTALAAASLASLAVFLPRGPEGAPLVATLRAESGAASLIVSGQPGRGDFMAIPASLAGPNGRVPELWLIAGGSPPRSLGLLDPTRAHSVRVPPELQPHARAGATLAVSLEPAGGSPTGSPTGPVVASGAFTQP